MIRRRRRRRAGRVVVRSTDGRVLLFRGGDPARPEAGTWWVTPGGGVDAGESTSDAARRELLEETGLAVADLGPVRMHRTTRFEFNGVAYKQKEDYFLVEGPAFDVDTSGWSPLERASVVEARWWPIDELRTTDEEYYPEELVGLAEGRPVRQRDLARIAVLLTAAWSLVVFLNGVLMFLDRWIQARALSQPDRIGWRSPAALDTSLEVLFFVWVIALNLATAGLVIGLIVAVRDGWRGVWRAVALVAVNVGGAVAEFALIGWADDTDQFVLSDFVHDGQLAGLLVALVAIAVVALSAALLLTSSGSARRRARSCRSPSPLGGTAP